MNERITRRVRRRAVDRAISLKERLPSELYRDPPSWFGYLLISFGVALISLLFIGMVILLYYSVLVSDPFEFIIYEFTVENWLQILSAGGIHRIFARTIGLTLVVTVISVGLALPYAYLTVRTRSAVLRKLLLASIFAPFVRVYPQNDFATLS
ncbi:hypothetical protein JCM18237_28570 [Halorubrum luteum]